jgi:PAS domain S-box-containing protein
VDIRTKLIFTLVAVSLGSMLILGAMTYSKARTLLTEGALDQLAALADTKQELVEELISDWRDRAGVAASAAQGSTAAVRTRLAAALASEETFESLAVYDAQGRLVATAARDGVAWAPPETLPATPNGAAEPTIVGTLLSDGGPHIVVEVAVALESEPPGVLRLIIDGRELSAITDNRSGFGETGETLIVGRVESGAPRVLTPLLHDVPSGDEVEDAALRALAGEEGEFVDALVDYRGEPVWAAVRHLPEVEWGLVVKSDAAEELAPIDRFRDGLTDVGTVLAAFAVVLGIAVGLRFANPIHELAAVATRIRNGELDARASVKREDEIGLFARTFNDMTDELERRMTLLLEFKKFFDVSIDMLCIAGVDGYFKRLNPAFERTLGWTNEQLVDEPFNELIHPDDIEATNYEIEKLSQGIPTISFTNRFRCSNGEYKLLMWTSYPEPETGLLYAVARDVTGQTQA